MLGTPDPNPPRLNLPRPTLKSAPWPERVARPCTIGWPAFGAEEDSKRRERSLPNWIGVEELIINESSTKCVTIVFYEKIQKQTGR